jgi:phospholipid transport system substrate-binding protein
MKKSFFMNLATLSLGIFLLFGSNNALANANEAQKFVEKVSNDALAIINSKANTKQKEDKLSTLFLASVDTKWIAHFAMGKYWREASDAQRNKYIEMHREYILGSYIPKFKEYNNQVIKITKSSTIGDGDYLVTTKIISKDGAAVNVDYKIKRADGKFMIFDVIAEGVSLITTQRSDFAAILSRGGVDELIKKLGEKL